MSAQEILKLIEAVDPSDTAKMDEIDALVWYYAMPKNSGYAHGIKYTRSRDALKAIRPKRYGFFVCQISDKTAADGATWWSGWNPVDQAIEFDTLGKNFPTEELAELQAIIQAIEFERKGDA